MATVTSISFRFLRYLLFNSLLFFSLLSFSSKSTFAYEEKETIESSHNLHHTHVVQISSLLPTSACKTSTKGTRNKGLYLEVAHKHGPCSKLNKNKANAPLSHTTILLQDQSRVHSIHSRVYNSAPNKLLDSAATLPAKSGSVVNAGNYIVTVGLGTPKTDLSLIFDTGSDLTWTQCEPCAGYCHAQKDPIFNPIKSASYTNISCNSALCSQLSSAGISTDCSTVTCVYGIQYGDQSYSVGFFGQEKLTLTPTEAVDNFYFGCGQQNRGLFGGSAGLIGLGRDQISIISQTATKYGKFFTYCLPSTPSSTGYLAFGQGGGVSTKTKFTPSPINSRYPSFYFIDIVGISVGGSKLTISPSIFSNAGSIIDSGTVITRLPPTAYTEMRKVFRQMMTKYPMASAESILDSCYDLSGYSSISIPKIRFSFSGGVEMDLDASGIVYVISTKKVCLAFAANGDDSDLAIFGNTQQKTFDIVYDVAGGRLGFGPAGCR